MHLLGITSIIYSAFRLIKEAFTPTLTADQWANKELVDKDRMNGMSGEEILKNAHRGRYVIPKEIFEAYPIPHRKTDGSNKIIIENDELWRKDYYKYGGYQVSKWVKQGKYNLNSKELEISNLKHNLNTELMESRIYGMDPERKAKIEELKRDVATKKLDWANTEALKQWQKAHDAENKFMQSKL